MYCLDASLTLIGVLPSVQRLSWVKVGGDAEMEDGSMEGDVA